MNRDTLEANLRDLAGEGEDFLSEDEIAEAKKLILEEYDRLIKVYRAAADVVRHGSLSDQYFDGREFGNAPAHRHTNPPKWDRINEVCEWCVSWTALRKLVTNASWHLNQPGRV